MNITGTYNYAKRFTNLHSCIDFINEHKLTSRKTAYIPSTLPLNQYKATEDKRYILYVVSVFENFYKTKKSKTPYYKDLRGWISRGN